MPNIKDLKNNSYFQQGVKDFKEGKVKLLSTNYSWIKKFIQVKEWNSWYKYHSNYCFLEKVEKKGVWIGFLIADFIPQDCHSCSDDELRQIDLYRRARRVFPFVFKDI